MKNTAHRKDVTVCVGATLSDGRNFNIPPVAIRHQDIFDFLSALQIFETAAVHMWLYAQSPEPMLGPVIRTFWDADEKWTNQ